MGLSSPRGTTLPPCPKAGQRWEAGQLARHSDSGLERSEGFWIAASEAATAQLGMHNYVHSCSGTWALLATEGCLSRNWSPRKLEWDLLPDAPWNSMCLAPPLPSRLNREHKETCEMAWSDKVEAYNIDETCARYNNESTEVQFHPHSSKFEER